MTEPQQPPAGWYPDPQDATQQRYWDGSAWTGHTAAQGGPTAAPVGAAAPDAAIPAAAAPAWTMNPAAMGAPTGKKPFFKRTWVIVTGVIIVVLIVIGAIVGSSSNHSNALENAILKDGQAQLQNAVSQDLPGATVKITKVNCVETGSSQKYNCQIHLTVTSPDGSTSKRFIQNATGSCDNSTSTYHCLWETSGTPVADNS